MLMHIQVRRNSTKAACEQKLLTAQKRGCADVKATNGLIEHAEKLWYSVFGR